MTRYHYTSAAGLRGIIESKSIWATDYRFLNDTSEFRHGWDIVIDTIERRQVEIRQKCLQAWDTVQLLRDFNKRSGVYAFVGSLTSEGDLLSQWRGYGGGKGFAIGFNPDWLERNAEEQDFRIFPVIYGADEQRACAEDVVTLLTKMLSDCDDKPAAIDEQVKNWWGHALKVALALKDSHFREEREFRIAWIGRAWPPGLMTRVSPAGLIPYRSFYFNKVTINNPIFHPNNCGIEEIIVGPALASQQAAAVDALLATNRMRLPIEKSKIPFIAD